VEQTIGLDDAVGLYTFNAAKNGFDENYVGTIREGARADLTLLDSSIDGIHPSMIRRVGVAATIVNGRVAYSYEGLV
jgi:predicted amidohydrolase YtcJ